MGKMPMLLFCRKMNRLPFLKSIAFQTGIHFIGSPTPPEFPMKTPPRFYIFVSALGLLVGAAVAADAPAATDTDSPPAPAKAPTYDPAISVPLKAGQVIELFPEGVPGWKDIGPEVVSSGTYSNISNPRMIVGLPPTGTPQNGTAIIFCAGGGYVHVAGPTGMNSWLNPLGITTFNLIYRCKEFGAPAPQQDVLRAVRLIRLHAKEFGIDPNKIGVMGDSAGGHVAASADTLFDDPVGKTGAEIDSVSARPDFAVLIFSVLTMEPPFAHADSKKNLIGANPTQEMIDQYSLEKHVTRNTPPTFIIHTQGDTTVKEENDLMFYAALRKNNVPSELHLYTVGPHGSGMGNAYGDGGIWPQLCNEWMRFNGWLPPGTRCAGAGQPAGPGRGGRTGPGWGARDWSGGARYGHARTGGSQCDRLGQLIRMPGNVHEQTWQNHYHCWNYSGVDHGAGNECGGFPEKIALPARAPAAALVATTATAKPIAQTSSSPTPLSSASPKSSTIAPGIKPTSVSAAALVAAPSTPSPQPDQRAISSMHAMAMAINSYVDRGNPRGLTAGSTDSAHVAASELARITYLNDAAIYFVANDPLAPSPLPKTVIVGDPQANPQLNPAFAHATLSVVFAANVPANVPGATTPVIWTRGLQDDGTWSSNSPYAGSGGYITFLDGHTIWADKLSLAPGGAALVKFGTNAPTANIQEALPPEAIVLRAEP